MNNLISNSPGVHAGQCICCLHKSQSDFPNKAIWYGTVLPVKSDIDVMFCLQSYQGLRINRSLHRIGLILT